MRFKGSDAKRRKILRRTVATIADLDARKMVMAAPHKALLGKPGDPVAFIWRPSGPVPAADPPIAEPFLNEMLLLLRANCSVILISDDHQSRDRAVALLQAALDDERPPVLS